MSPLLHQLSYRDLDLRKVKKSFLNLATDLWPVLVDLLQRICERQNFFTGGKLDARSRVQEGSSRQPEEAEPVRMVQPFRGLGPVGKPGCHRDIYQGNRPQLLQLVYPIIRWSVNLSVDQLVNQFCFYCSVKLLLCSMQWDDGAPGTDGNILIVLKLWFFEKSVPMVQLLLLELCEKLFSILERSG